MSRASWKTWSGLAAAAALLSMAGLMNSILLKQRKAEGLMLANPLTDSPPLVAFTTIALGGFRGILADALWVRASRLQAEGKYFEQVQLARWITQLEPRFTEVWAWQAWNLAYNISVLFQSPEDRWRWLSAGISLLRDRGLEYNPGSANLYRELGWLFEHKLGGLLDQAHWYYKRAWAEEMMELFDGPRPDYARCAQIPRDRQAMLKIPGMKSLVEKIENAGLDPFDRHLSEQLKKREDMADLLDGNAGRLLLDYLRIQRMEQEYKLFPEKMKAVDEQYGPLDWRLSQAHAIYWAWQGRPFAKGFDDLQLDRMIFQALAEAFRRGSLFIDPEHQIFIATPNLDLLPRVRAAYEDSIRKNPGNESVKLAYANFLAEAITILYTNARFTQAKALYAVLADRYPDQAGADFSAYVYKLLTEDMKDLSPRNIIALLEGTLFQSYYWLAMGEEDRSAGYRRLAILLRRQYMHTYASETQQERLGLPPMKQLENTAREQAYSLFNQPEKTP